MRLLVWVIGLGIRVGGFPIRLVLGAVWAIVRRLRWLRPVARMGLKLLVAVRSNSMASTAITLSIINFGLLMWQIWPEDTGQVITDLSPPTTTLETPAVDNTSLRLTELENQIRQLSVEQRFQFDRLRECINFPSPFGC